jgi:cytochrome bd-type quinol oxidase subunit 1/mono/diheme cytochrome c family protein
MNYPVWNLDVFGGGLWIVLIAVFHVYISHFAVGGGLFLVLAERKAQRENDPAMLEYVRRHARFFLLLTMVAGSITGVGIWFVMSLLNPAATSILVHTFVFAWGSEWVFFLIEIVALFLYYASFDRMESGRRQVLGWIYFGAAWMSLALINGVIGFMLTPGDWPRNADFWSGFFNPSFWPSLFFRTFLALIIAGLFGLTTAAWLKDARLRTVMIRFCAHWLLIPFVFFVASAAWYRAALPAELQETIFARMPSMRPYVDGFLLCSPVLVAAGLLLILRLPAGLARALAMALLLIGQLYIGCFEFIREGGRKPYIIREVMYSTSILKKDADRIRQEGVLTSAKWVRHHGIADANRLAAGRELYNLLCLACHSVGGPMRDIKQLTASFTPSGLDAMISGMEMFYPAMPPFAGTPKERAALALYVAQGLNGRSDPAPAAGVEKKVEIPAFDPASSPFVLLAWSPQSMRGVGEVKGVLSLLPPGNSLRAQLIKRGETPEIVNQGVTLGYRFGPDGGEGKPAVSGEMTAEEDVFVADNIPLRPGVGQSADPYPTAMIEARDENDALLAATVVVAPVSAEIGCSGCHGGDGQDDRPGLHRETAFHILGVHDRLSGTALLTQARGGATVRCQSCHADALVKAKGDPARLNLSAAIHGFHANYLRGKGAEACGFCHPSGNAGAARCLRDIHAAVGMDCVNCHGKVEDHALGLLQHERRAGKGQAAALMAHLRPASAGGQDEIAPRQPWINQPDCLHCHVDFQAPETDTIANNARTNDEQGLYRNRTDDSGRLFCAACHSGAHAVYPADNPASARLDVLQPLQYQGNRLPLGANRNCAVCHTVAMADEMHHANSLRAFRNE